MTEEFERSNVDLRRLAIGVRKRSTHETRDLAVRVFFKETKNLLFYFGLLALPVYLLDVVLWFFILRPYRWAGSYSVLTWFFPTFGDFGCTTCNLLILWLTILFESAFVGSLATQYLGLWLFAGGEKIERRKVFRLWRERFFALFCYLVFPNFFHPRPYYAETILLERAPFRKRAERSSIAKRVRYILLEGGANGFLFLELYYLTPGTFAGCFTLGYFTHSLIAERPLCFYLLCFVIFPIFIFLCRLYKVVFNFLAYINYRISFEGWDVRLAFESEVAKYLQDETLGVSTSSGLRSKRRARRDELSPLELEREDESEARKEEVK